MLVAWWTLPLIVVLTALGAVGVRRFDSTLSWPQAVVAGQVVGIIAWVMLGEAMRTVL